MVIVHTIVQLYNVYNIYYIDIHIYIYIYIYICEFYPSISEELLRNSLDYAKTHTNIDDQEVDMIMACRKSVLFNDGKTWTKKDKNFDVTMGAQGGAEVAELTGIYLLKQVEDFLSSLGDKAHVGLYRDDGLICIENANGPLINKHEKALHRIFKRNHLKISIEQKGLLRCHPRNRRMI